MWTGRYGLSYTTFELSNLTVSSTSIQKGPDLEFEVAIKVTNTGSVAGSEVVQVYVSLPEFGLTTPRLQLRGFAKARDLAPGESAIVTVKLDKYAVSWWDTRGQQWKAVPGTYGIHAGKSSTEIVLESEFVLENGFTWVGL